MELLKTVKSFQTSSCQPPAASPACFVSLPQESAAGGGGREDTPLAFGDDSGVSGPVTAFPSKYYLTCLMQVLGIISTKDLFRDKECKGIFSHYTQPAQEE